jgi:CTP synthase (UTP-ammonia lyase)
VGDYDASVTAHRSLPLALERAAQELDLSVDYEWSATEPLGDDTEALLGKFDAIWSVPGSPYVSMEGALRAIRFAREQERPFLGTCGGFQHAVIEYARDVLGYAEADHTESNPNAKLPLISPLACSLAETQGTVTFLPGSKVGRIYGQATATEQYNCNFGFNPCYRSILEHQMLYVSGVDDRGDARVVELEDHPFFIATLFQPERAVLSGVSHPLIKAFVSAAAGAQ